MDQHPLDARVREACDRLLSGPKLQVDANPVAAVRHRVAHRARRRRAVTVSAITGLALVLVSAVLLASRADHVAEDVDVIASP